MASTPLYKSLKANGTSFYAFPSAAEDISAAYQNSIYKMYFSKYVLLNFPTQNLTSGTISRPIYWDFDNSFEKSVVATPVTNYADGVVESLRNYVANHEVVLRESRLSGASSSYYYDTNALETTTEKIFFKWCRKLNLIDFDVASPEDDYVGNLSEFQTLNGGDSEFFPEFLWKERQVKPYNAISFYQTPSAQYPGNLEVEFEFVGGSVSTNFKIGDVVNIYNVVYTAITDNLEIYGYNADTGLNVNVLDIIPPSGATAGQKIIFDVPYFSNFSDSGNILAKFELVYHKLVQYIGEINGVSNVQEANRAYTEVFAHVPDHAGQTPDILFRTAVDKNYKPNLTLPILPSQYQSEILGAENFNSPIVSSPQNYPGSYYGQFDTNDFTYETSTGDALRRSGDYFGLSGDVNTPVFNSDNIDGLTLDFDTRHYAKMNIPKSVSGRTLTNFDQFNALAVDGEIPKDFEFNAILWYYTVEKEVTNPNGTRSVEVKTNLYGISFLNNPITNTTEGEENLRFPTYKKLVSNEKLQQDGTSYAFSLNLNFNIINDNTIETYNPEAINSLFSMNLFNQAMSRLSSLNDSFINIIAENSLLKEEIQNVKSLLYTQTDINVLNSKIANLERLLRLYSTIQIQNSPSIRTNFTPGNPPTLSLETTDTPYTEIRKVNTSTMYSTQGAVPIIIGVPFNKKFMIHVVNNDEVELDLPEGEKLTLVIDKDLSLRQSLEINIVPSQFSSENKKLDIFLKSNFTGQNTEILILGDIDLPVSYNKVNDIQNTAYLWKQSNLEIDFDKPMTLLQGNLLEVPFSNNLNILQNSVKTGDTYEINNLFVGTASVYDFSGQYVINSISGITSSYATFDVSSNKSIVDFGASASLPLQLHGTSSSLLSNYPYISLNKGKKIILTRISDSANIEERYYVEVSDIM